MAITTVKLGISVTSKKVQLVEKTADLETHFFSKKD